MNKDELVRFAVERANATLSPKGRKQKRLSQETVKRSLDAVTSSIVDHVLAGERVYVREFGIFCLKLRKAKIGRNPKTNEEVPVPPRYNIVFKPSKEFAEAIAKKHVPEYMYDDEEELEVDWEDTGSGDY